MNEKGDDDAVSGATDKGKIKICRAHNELTGLFQRLERLTILVDEIPDKDVEDGKRDQELVLKSEIRSIRQAINKHLDGLETALVLKCSNNASTSRSLAGNKQTPKVKLKATIKAPKGGEFPFLTGGLFLPDGKVILADNSNRLLIVCTEDGKLQKLISLPGQPWDICFVDSDQKRAAVSLPNDQMIQFVMLEEIKLNGCITVQGKCYGISCFQDKLIVACVAELIIMDMTGQLLRTLSVRGDGVYFSAHYVCAVNEETIYFTDWCNHVLHCINMDGKEKFQYINKDLKCPKGMTVDRDGDVYVAGSLTHNIQHVSPDGHLIGAVLSKYDGISNARAIGFKADNSKLFVAYGNNIAKIYDVIWS